MNSGQNYELKKKIAQVFQVHPESSRRISDYIGNAGFVLENQEIYIEMGKMWVEQIQKLQDEFKKISDKILFLEVTKIIQILEQNPPKWKGTEWNVESIKQAFIH